MEPIFIDRSIVFVDKTANLVIDGQVYVFIHDGLVRMKSLERIPKGFRMKSYNDNYPAEDINVQYETIKIVGKVIGQLQMYC